MSIAYFACSSACVPSPSVSSHGRQIDSQTPVHMSKYGHERVHTRVRTHARVLYMYRDRYPPEVQCHINSLDLKTSFKTRDDDQAVGPEAGEAPIMAGAVLGTSTCTRVLSCMLLDWYVRSATLPRTYTCSRLFCLLCTMIVFHLVRTRARVYVYKFASQKPLPGRMQALFRSSGATGKHLSLVGIPGKHYCTYTYLYHGTSWSTQCQTPRSRCGTASTAGEEPACTTRKQRRSACWCLDWKRRTTGSHACRTAV